MPRPNSTGLSSITINPSQGLVLNLRKKSTTITRIIQYPDAWSALSKNSRRSLVNRFPYGVIYQVKSRSLRIIAVAHLNRRPGYWKERLE
jgi:hypothetical protein